MPLTHQIAQPQTVFNELTSDTTTTSGSYTSLISVSITTGPYPIIVDFTVSADNSSGSNRAILYRLSIDGNVKRGTAHLVEGTGDGFSAGLVYKSSALSEGSHTVLIEWLRNTDGTARIRPAGAPDDEHCSLLVYEVTV